MNEKEILEKMYQTTKSTVIKQDFNKFNVKIQNNVDFLIRKIEQNKSIVSALATSLLKKILEPRQDIRLHRKDFQNGYSARSLDTKFTSPFFKNYFPRYANKESAFLTLATREKIRWTKEEGKNLKIRNENLKECFLNIFEEIEIQQENPEKYLEYLFVKLIELSSKDDSILQLANEQNIGILNINIIISMLEEHFSEKLASRLPVIAIYSIYEILIKNLKRYKNKKLLPLKVHTSSDKHAFGDIEIYENDEKPYEIVEIKHNIPIDNYLIFDIVKKIKYAKISRYYILTTFKECFATEEEKKSVNDLLIQINKQKEIDIIANGIISTLKYYLRFIDDYRLFVDAYTKNLINDVKSSTETKSFHVERWIKILEKHKIDKQT